MTRILLDIETCPEWLEPPRSDVPEPIPERFRLAAEAKRRDKAPVRWKKIDEMKLRAPDQSLWAEEYQKEVLEVQSLAEELAFDGALDPLAGRIVAIGVQIAGDPTSRRLFPAFQGWEEEGQLKSLVLWLRDRVSARLGDHLVVLTYNGRGFDEPFLRFRGLKHDLRGLPGFWRDLTFDTPCVRQYARWKDDASGPIKVPKLSALCEALGMAPSDDLHGSEVPRLVREGRIDEVLKHLGRDLDRLEFLDAKLGRP
jgi:hypothetical protein